MRDLRVWDGFRIETAVFEYGAGADGGAFRMPSPVDGMNLLIIASTGYGWDHVSISRPRRTPTWGEMEFVKRRFFRDDETAYQYHVPPAEHRSLHPFCLHLWRNQTVEIPRPPGWLVAPDGMGGETK